MATERQIQTSPETVPIEDTLPTANFLSTLTGLDKEYPHFIGEDLALWSGVGTFNNEAVRLTIGHVHGETSFYLETKDRIERWEIKESSCDIVTVRQSFQVVHGTLLNDVNRVRLKDTLWAKLSFCRGMEDMQSREKYYCCSDCHMLQEGAKRIDGMEGSANKPSEYPMRGSSQVNRGASKVQGFQTVDEAITALVNLRNILISLEEVPADVGPIPPGQSLVSEAYFPS